MQNLGKIFKYIKHLKHICRNATQPKIYGIFAICAAIMLAIVAFRLDSIDSDIYSLLDFSHSQKQALSTIQQHFAKDISFLSDDELLLDEIFANVPQNLFSSIKLNLRDLATHNAGGFESLYPLSLALLDYDTYQEVVSKPKEFFHQNAKELLHSFALRPLKPNIDFFNLVGHSSLLNNKGLQLDIASTKLYALDEITQKKYYVASAHLGQTFSTKELLDFIADSRNKAKQKNAHLLIQGGAIFSAIGKQEGIKESIYMGTLSLLLVGLLLFMAFGSVRIFWLIVVVGFSFLCGLSAGLLLCSHLHILCIVISTSLVGLIVDFAMHWLAKEVNTKANTAGNKPLQAKSIISMRRIFLLGLFITISGYGLFLLSAMEFLHQIAIMSIFALLGAFFSSYFLLPHILQGSVFKPKYAFRKPFIATIKCLKPFFRRYIYILPPFVIIILVVLLICADIRDDISKYSSLPKESLIELQDFARISKSNNGAFILCSDMALERELMKEIQHFIDKYDGLSAFVLSKQEQQEVINAFTKASNDKEILGFYENLGFSNDEITKAFAKVASLKVLGVEQILSSNIGAEFKRFVLLEDAPLSHNQHLQKTKSSYISFPHFTSLEPHTNDELHRILAKYEASLIVVAQSINENFSAIKFNAIWLKIFGYVIAFLALSFAFGYKKSATMIGVVLISSLASLAVVLACGIGFNIFVVFGLILSSAVGIDYVLVASNHHLSPKERVFGITLASLTSVFSFCLLSISSTKAVVAFGVSVALGMAFCAIGAIALALKIPKS